MKVIHLYQKLQEIEKDLIELNKIKERISSGREYFNPLNQSILEEIEKLEIKRKEILDCNILSELNHISQFSNSKNTTEEIKNLYISKENDLNSEIKININDKKDKVIKKINRY